MVAHSDRFLLAQMNPAPGDLAGNARQILAGLRQAEAVGAGWVLYPELALMGYPIRDVIVRYPHLVQDNLHWLHALAARTGETYAVVGFVEPRWIQGGSGGGQPYYNSVAILGEGRVLGVVRKSLLPQYQEFHDPRTFEPSVACGVIPPEFLGQAEAPDGLDGQPFLRDGRRLAFSICEDLWADETFYEHPPHPSNPIARLMAHAPDLLINLSASPSRARKEGLRHALLSHVARRFDVPLLYVNQVGAVDESSFDGASRWVDGTGALRALAHRFQTDALLLAPFESNQPAHRVSGSPASPTTTAVTPPHPWPPTGERLKRYAPDDPDELARTAHSLRQGIRDYFQKTGFQRALLGLSGGLDSSVCAALLAWSLGPENVLGVSMPSTLTPDENRTDAYQMAQRLGIGWTEIPIAPVVDAFLEPIQPGIGVADVSARWGAPDTRSFARDNVQAMSRATLLRLLGNEYRALPIATSDKSEFYLGYTTVNGDMSGALAPLGDVTKTRVRALGRYLNGQLGGDSPVLPEVILQRPPGADLAVNPETGRLLTAEEVLMPYAFADEVIWRIEALHQGFADLLETPFAYEAEHPLSAAQKRAWLTRFFQRMSAAVFKWWVAPPILIVDGNGSLAQSDYQHPITACRIAWQGTTPEQADAAVHAMDADLGVVLTA